MSYTFGAFVLSARLTCLLMNFNVAVLKSGTVRHIL